MSDSIVNDYEAIAARVRELEKPGKRTEPGEMLTPSNYDDQLRAAKRQVMAAQQGRIPGNYNAYADDDIEF